MSVATLLRSDNLWVKLIPGEQVGVICVHRDVKDYPVAHATLSTAVGTASLKVGVMPGLQHGFVIGKGCPIIWGLPKQKMKGSETST